MNTKKIVRFALLAFALSWLLAGVFYVAGVRYGTPPAMVMAAVYMFGPMVAAIIVQHADGENVIGRLGVKWNPNRWWLLAWLVPPILCIAAFGVSLLLPGIHFSPDLSGLLDRLKGSVPPEQMAQIRSQLQHVNPVLVLLLSIVSGMMAGATVNAVFAFGEELGWRGLMLKEMAPMGFWRASLAIGVIWGVWHAPLILQGHNYPQHPGIGVAMMIAFTTLLSPIFCWVRLRAGSVLAAAIVHGTLNGVAGASVLFIAGGNDLTSGMLGIPGLTVLLIADILLFVLDRRPQIELAA